MAQSNVEVAPIPERLDHHALNFFERNPQSILPIGEGRYLQPSSDDRITLRDSSSHLKCASYHRDGTKRTKGRRE